MRLLRSAILLGLLLSLSAPCFAIGQPSTRWESLLDVTYQFSWYPKQDLQNLLENKAQEFGQSLEEYRNLLVQELTVGGTPSRLLDAELLVQGKPWKKYYNLSLAEFCLFLASDREESLVNAKTALSVLSGRLDQFEIGFWYYYYAAYDDLIRKDSQAFVASVFRVWQNIVLKLEIDDILMESAISKTGFVKSLPYLYENLAHLIVKRAIVEKEMADLYPLGGIVLDLSERLEIENGYKNIIDPVVERMHGVNSDNLNLNYAVTYLEATANRYEFEDEQSSELVESKFNKARKYYRLAYAWSDTRKGKAAILTQYMGFLNYITRRISDGNDILAVNPFFKNIPSVANDYLDNAVLLFDEMALPHVQQGGYVAEGFDNKNDYLETMHSLWDVSAKLAIRLADYYMGDRTDKDINSKMPAEIPLNKYNLLFQKHAKQNSDIVPDNAFFLAAYAAGELADLQRQLSAYSTDGQTSLRAFAYQLQAVEIFPINLPGILQLAYQSAQDGLSREYFRYTTPVASLFRTSKVTDLWLANNTTPNDKLIAIVPEVSSDVFESAHALINFQTTTESSADGLFRKTLAMGWVGAALRANGADDTTIDTVLAAIGILDFSASGANLDTLIAKTLPQKYRQISANIDGLAENYQFSRLKNELYGSTDHPVHGYLRDVYYDIPYESHQYVEMVTSMQNSEVQ